MRDPSDQLNDLLEKLNPLDLKAEQKKDEVIKRVVQWKLQNNIDDLQYVSFALNKKDRLVLIENILYRQFFDHTGTVYCLPKHLRKEVIYRLHNSPRQVKTEKIENCKNSEKGFTFLILLSILVK